MHKQCIAGIFFISIGIVSITPPIRSTWSEIAHNDVIAVYHQLKDNHPGYCDTENPQWKSILEAEYCNHTAQALQVLSYDEYKGLMQSFTRSFKDGHLGIQFTDKDFPDNTVKQLPEKAHIAEFSPDCIWVKLPLFHYKTEEERFCMEEVIRNIAHHKTSKIIVFDVRGNTGGSSEWGTNLLNALFSENYVNQQMAAIEEKHPVYVEWRASKNNIDHLKSFLTPENVRALNFEKHVPAVQAVITGLQTALSHNEPFFKEAADIQYHKTTKAHISSPVTATIFLLTDSSCASACLDFADTLFALTPVIHVGHSTNADTAYMECRSIPTPSKKAMLIFPIKVYRNRIRKPYQKYHPSPVWTGDIHDTQALQSWILSLSNR